MSDGWVGVPATQAAGRFPANAILDEHAAAIVDEQSGDAGGGFATRGGGGSVYGGGKGYAGTSTETGQEIGYGDSGGASRFFYNAKASKRERPVVDGVAHTTVKPLSVMRWLLRMVTPPGGTVLEPFAGSGTTVEAAMLEGFSCIAIEKDETYMPLIQARIDRQGETLGLL
jgi:site-specific DNA-methyltransferase (adenine-specific)